MRDCAGLGEARALAVEFKLLNQSFIRSKRKKIDVASGNLVHASAGICIVDDFSVEFRMGGKNGLADIDYLMRTIRGGLLAQTLLCFSNGNADNRIDRMRFLP